MTYWVRNILNFPRNVFYEVKYGIQRAKNGFSIRDTYNIDCWFLNIMPNMLKKFNKINMGYPISMKEDEWKAIIEDMIFHFTNANEDTCSEINEYEDEFLNSKEDFSKLIDSELGAKYRDRAIEIEKFQNEELKKGFELFTKYFKDLWW